VKASNMNAQQEIQNENENMPTQATSKVGTWISVGVVGIVILATYFLLFGFYMDRL
jgi:hypothetical protein